MRYLVTKRLPCSVCGLDTFSRAGWFLAAEDPWLDRLRIFTWHPSLAVQKDIKSACCRQHLRALLSHWLNQASLHLSPANHPPRPIGGCPSGNNPELTGESAGQLVGELSVHRDAFSSGWTGSPATLDCILDALIPEETGIHSGTEELQPFPLHQSQPGFALHESTGRPAT